MKDFAPVKIQERVQVVDALRGLALLGILLANVPYLDAAAQTSVPDKVVKAIFHLFIDKKFITIFSILFGFGFYVQLKRAEEKFVDFQSYYIKRLLLLLLIGCLHAYLLWYGDIIRDYAICGIF